MDSKEEVLKELKRRLLSAFNEANEKNMNLKEMGKILQNDPEWFNKIRGLTKSFVASALIKLRENNLLHLSMEQVIIDYKECHEFFNEEELEMCREKLKWKNKPYNS